MKDWIPVKLHQIEGEKSSVIAVSESLYGILGLSEGKITVYAGLTKEKAILKKDIKLTGNSAYLSSVLLRHLYVPEGITLGSRAYKNGQELHFGPVVGIMADPRKMPKPFGEQNSFIHNLITAANRLNCYAYAFYYTDNIANGIITGYRSTSEGWQRKKMPLPDVVYDRCLVMTHDQFSALSKIKRKLRNLGVLYFNRSLGSKLRMYNVLSEFSELRPYLPETVVANSESVRRLLSRHKTIYVKPSMGTQGKSVIRVTRVKNRGYSATFVRDGRRLSATSKTIAGIMHNMRMRQGKVYLAQQGIDLVKFGTRIADIRVLTQRNIDGNWLVTGAAARIGQSGSPVSNIHQGGGALSLTRFLEKAFPDANISKEDLRKETYTLAIKVSEALDAGIGDIAELGVDIGIDKNARIWLIEANPRPGRTVFRLIGNKTLQLRSIIRPVEYACYIASERYRRKEQQDVQKAHGTDRT